MIYPRFFTFHCHLLQVRLSFASNPLLNRSYEWEANGICNGFATDLQRTCMGDANRGGENGFFVLFCVFGEKNLVISENVCTFAPKT